jgi:branched-chain amino acid transport system permease protein
MDDLFIIIVVRGIGIGAVYALVAISFNVVYNASGILNFAQGHMLILGGMFASMVLPPQVGFAAWLGLLVLVALAVAVIMAVQGYVTLLPLKSSVEQHSWLITTLAASVIISALLLLTKGPFTQVVRSPFPPLRAFGVATPAGYLIAPVLAVGACLALRWFHRHTLTGLAMSAIAQDLDAAKAAGITVRRLQILSFAISGLIVGAAGFAAGSILTISPSSPISYVLNGFIAAVIGGIGSNAGALVGGALVGVLSMWAAYAVGGDYQNAASFAFLVMALMLRPQGLFGRVSARQF